jgi:hypothetical protein
MSQNTKLRIGDILERNLTREKYIITGIKLWPKSDKISYYIAQYITFYRSKFDINQTSIIPYEVKEFKLIARKIV